MRKTHSSASRLPINSRRYRHINGMVLPSSNSRTMFELVSWSKNFNWHKSSSSVHVFRVVFDFGFDFVSTFGFFTVCAGGGVIERCTGTFVSFESFGTASITDPFFFVRFALICFGCFTDGSGETS